MATGWPDIGVGPIPGIAALNTDDSIEDAKARWLVKYTSLLAKYYPKYTVADIRAVSDPTVPFSVYLAAFDRLVANGVFAGWSTTLIAKYRVAATRMSVLVSGNTGNPDSYSLTNPFYSDANAFYAFIDGRFYLPSYYDFPGVSFGGTGISQPKAGYTYFGVDEDYKTANKMVLDPATRMFSAPLVKFKMGIDQSGKVGPIEMFDVALQKFVTLPYIQPSLRRSFVVQEFGMSQADKTALAMDMAESGLFKVKTQYIIIGDEVKGDGTIDFKSLLPEADYIQLVQYLTFMPRQFLRNFFMVNIYPQIPTDAPYPAYINFKMNTMIKDEIYGGYYQFKPFNDMLWAAFVDIFNTANLKFINENQMDPWAWEEKKLFAYNTSVSQEEMTALQQSFDKYSDATLVLDPKAKAVMDDFATLPKLGDIGHEINRQNAIKELLKNQEYELAQAIVDAFRYAKDTVLGPALEKPIAEPVILSNGAVIAEKSTPIN